MKKSIRIALEATGLKPVYKLLWKSKLFLQKQVAKQLQRLRFSSEVLGPPKGISTVSDLRNQKISYIEIFPSEKVQLPVQRFTPSYGSLQKTETRETVTTHSLSSYVLTLDQARIYGDNGLILTQEDHMVEEFAGSFRGRSAAHEIFYTWKLPPPTKVKGRCAVVGYNYAHGYYHWMLEILPRIELLRRSGLSYDHVYMNRPQLPFQMETLNKIPFHPAHVLWADENAHFKVDQAIIPSVHVGEIPLWVCTYLQSLFLPVAPTSSSAKKRLFVSRRKAARRRILNEEKLKSMLAPFGFCEVLLEDYTVAEQAALFHQAECIIAAHGAALTNLVFCSPKTIVVELFSPIRTYSNYQTLSRLMKLEYHGLLTCTRSLSKTEVRKQDLIVDCTALLQYLQENIDLFQKKA